MANKKYLRNGLATYGICLLLATAIYSGIIFYENSRSQADDFGGAMPAIIIPPPAEEVVVLEDAPEEPVIAQPEIEEVTDPTLNWPTDKLFITADRQTYQEGQVVLVIPKLGKVLPLKAGVTEDDLRDGAGLYDYSQLPGEGINRNVSIAGHRNTSIGGIITDNAPFYYIDTLVDGDYIYLADANNIYRYLYQETYIVEQDDWGPIYSQGYSAVTITSCHPIGIANQRIVAHGKLDQIFPYAEDFEYIAAVE